jgi:hypothetical protein
MATERQFRHEDFAVPRRGWKVRTVAHPSGHRVRIAFPPGRRRKGSGQVISILHPIAGANPCANPCIANPDVVEWVAIQSNRGIAQAWGEASEGYRQRVLESLKVDSAGEHAKKPWKELPAAVKRAITGKPAKNVFDTPRERAAYAAGLERGGAALGAAEEKLRARRASRVERMMRSGLGRNPLQIRKATYRGKPGFHIEGRVTPGDFMTRVFTESRESAERIKAKLRAGEEIKTEDFNPGEVVLLNAAAEGWKTVSGVPVGRSDFAYVGDPERTETWKLPLHDDGHIRNAMGRFSRTDLPQSARREVAEKIVAAARRRGIASAAFEAKHLGRRNPETSPDVHEGADLYRQFHDRDPKQLVEVQEADEVRGTYVALGKLAELVFRAPSGARIKLDFTDDETKLASSPQGTQLYLIGGDQALNGGLEKFGSDTSKDFVDLGEAESVTYLARKKANSFHEAYWKHKLGEDGGTRPWGFYDQIRKRIYLVGGSYTVSDWIRN